ncbi:hypothetical protein AMTRI_Chr12g238030 [Amborella trichopoda]
MGWFGEVGNTSAEVGSRLAAGVRAFLSATPTTAVAGIIIAFEANWQLILIFNN